MKVYKVSMTLEAYDEEDAIFRVEAAVDGEFADWTVEDTLVVIDRGVDE
jgi:hypothetical protein